MIARMQFISNETAQFSHLESIKLALDAGCQWIQLRVKNQPEAIVITLAAQARQLCDSYQAKLIINDYPKVAVLCEADGLHLGLDDAPLSEARKITGPNMIMGGTANTLEHVQQRMHEGADYIGLGPLRYTTTKQKLSPILGFEGFEKIISELPKTQPLPKIIAIGGITENDIPKLLDIGIYGFAMSGEITGSKNPSTIIEKIKILC